MGVEDLNIKKEIVNVISLDSFVYKNKLKPNFIKIASCQFTFVNI